MSEENPNVVVTFDGSAKVKYCQHCANKFWQEGVTINEKNNCLTCNSCQSPIDPMDFLITKARRKLMFQFETHRKVENQLGYNKLELKNLKSQVKDAQQALLEAKKAVFTVVGEESGKNQRFYNSSLTPNEAIKQSFISLEESMARFMKNPPHGASHTEIFRLNNQIIKLHKTASQYF